MAEPSYQKYLGQANKGSNFRYTPDETTQKKLNMFSSKYDLPLQMNLKPKLELPMTNEFK